MSQKARDALVTKLIFQRDSERADLENEGLTQTQLIGLLTGLTGQGHFIEVTAVRTDHSDDSALGEHCHAKGWCVDCWPLASPTPGDYLDAGDPRFQKFLRDADANVYLYQIGLAGSAWTDVNVAAAGPTVFHDDGEDHLHLGSH